MKRWIAWLLALMLLLPAAALAVSYPAQRGAVNDDAGVLSEQTAADIEQLNTAARSADISFAVATRHFLGGADAQTYCDGLFEAWKLDQKTVLVLLVIGEERYAVAVGQGVRDMIGQEQINSLLAAKLRAPYLNDRNYDGAVGDFLLALTAQAAKSRGVTVKTSGLFGSAQESASVTQPAVSDQTNDSSWYNWTGDWWNGFFSTDDTEYYQASDTAAYARKESHYEDENTGFSLGKLIFFAVVLMIISNRRKAKGKSGLGLFGWIVAGKGLKELMKGRRR